EADLQIARPLERGALLLHLLRERDVEAVEHALERRKERGGHTSVLAEALHSADRLELPPDVLGEREELVVADGDEAPSRARHALEQLAHADDALLVDAHV